MPNTSTHSRPWYPFLSLRFSTTYAPFSRLQQCLFPMLARNFPLAAWAADTAYACFQGCLLRRRSLLCRTLRCRGSRCNKLGASHQVTVKEKGVGIDTPEQECCKIMFNGSLSLGTQERRLTHRIHHQRVWLPNSSFKRQVLALDPAVNLSHTRKRQHYKVVTGSSSLSPCHVDEEPLTLTSRTSKGHVHQFMKQCRYYSDSKDDQVHRHYRTDALFVERLDNTKCALFPCF
jgi:hypothetical protein